MTILWLGCQSEKQDDTSIGLETYPVTQPILIDTVYAREYVADVQSVQHVELRVQVGGFLAQIHVDEGQEVQEGQLLFSLSDKLFREELRQAEAALTSALAQARVAEVEAANTRALVEKGIVGRPELNMSEARLEALLAGVEQARAAVSAAELKLSFTRIRAPFSGILNREPLKEGSLLSEGDLLTTLSSNKEVFVYFNVSEKEFLEWQMKPETEWKKNLSLQLADGRLHPYRGHIETTESVVDKNTGSIAFRARFPNPGHVLKHGSTGKVQVFDQLKEVLVIPQKSTFEVQDKTYVFILDPENKVERRSIVPKLRLGHLYVVESGLTQADRVLYEGISQVREGDKIDAKAIPLSQIIPLLAQL